MGCNDRDKEDPYHETQPNVDGSQPQQLNSSVRCHTCGCEVKQDIGEGGDDGGDADAIGFRNGAPPTHHDRRGRGVKSVQTDSIQGDEGLENEKVEYEPWTRQKVSILGHGLISFRAIFEGLARHKFCTCHPSGFFPESGVNSPDASGMISISSTQVELGSSDERSMENSGYIARVSSSTQLEFLTLVGVRLIQDIPFNPSLSSFFTGVPLCLTGEPAAGYPYPEEAQISDEESSDEDDDDWTVINPGF